MDRSGKRVREPQPFRRKVHFGPNDVWSYKVGRQWAMLRSPDCRRTYRVDLSELCMEGWDELERAVWKGYWSGVAPTRVRQYIEWHLRTPPEIGTPDAYVHPRWPSRDRWHLFRECHQLPHLPRQLYDPRQISFHELKRILKQPPAAENLCSSCMHRLQTPPARETPPCDVRLAFRGVVLMDRATPEEAISARHAGLTVPSDGVDVRTAFGHATIKGLRARIGRMSADSLDELSTARRTEGLAGDAAPKVLDALGVLDGDGQLTEIGRAVMFLYRVDEAGAPT